MFRHSSIYVRADSSMTLVSDLATKRIGVPEWAQTAAVYSRGILQHRYGVDLRSVRWTQGGVNDPGRREKVALSPPAGLALASVADRSLNDMLLAGDLDAVLSARPPAGLATGAIRRLVEDYPEVERAFYKDTGVFPIMHLLAMRREVHERYPWVARNLVEGFELAKRASLVRMADATASWVPLPWITAVAGDAVELFGDDPWPYGVDANRATIETFLSYAAEQGVCSRQLEPEELFPASALLTVKV
jgi:4,5-dihydroxyphthalate decarboxylase